MLIIASKVAFIQLFRIIHRQNWREFPSGNSSLKICHFLDCKAASLYIQCRVIVVVLCDPG